MPLGWMRTWCTCNTNYLVYVVNFRMQLLGGEIARSPLCVTPTHHGFFSTKCLTWTRRRGAGFRAVLLWKLRRPFLGCTGAIDVELCTFVNLFSWGVTPRGICSAVAYHLRGRRSFLEHLRSKAHVDLILSDRALFEQMQVRDVWLDGRLPAVWAYIYGHKHVTIRPGWENAMKEFDLAVTQLVPHHYSFVSHIFIYESKTTNDIT